MMLHILTYIAAYMVGVAFFAGCIGAGEGAIHELRSYGKIVALVSAIVAMTCVMAVRHA
ncbi:hypothetical protein [Gluconobacter oxydans]|uniref:hypothetical protein n=1 Tax=Gluconobacter oxydans TaxID=442 RepID=UPI002648FD8E|nr:hypothetical protein [Gluconobacter oxydans]WKE49052.1 hypothetical protein NUJ38_04880 [Gluconobacter oxydans]